jgi:hypothetical protein
MRPSRAVDAALVAGGLTASLGAVVICSVPCLQLQAMFATPVLTLLAAAAAGLFTRARHRARPQPRGPVLVRLRFAAIRCSQCEVAFEDGQEIIQWPDSKLTHPTCTPQLTDCDAQGRHARIVDGRGFGGR